MYARGVRACVRVLERVYMCVWGWWVGGWMSVCLSVSVVSVIVKRPVFPLCVVDGRSKNLLYYYYHY